MSRIVGLGPKSAISLLVLTLALGAASGCSCATGDGHEGDDANLPDGSADGSASPDGSRDAGRDANVDAGDTGPGMDGATDAAMFLPDGAMILPDGAVVLPDGAVVLPDGAMMMPDGGVCASDAECDDGYTCTVDTCAGGICMRTISTTVCTDDGLFCNGGSACSPTSASADAVTGCAATPPPDCTDGSTCTNDSCDEVTDSCSNVPNDAMCDDGLFCTGLEHCAPGTTGADADGCVSGAAPSCDDGFDCTTDACDAASDACVSSPVHASCDDGLVCDGVEQCAPGAAGADGRGCVDGTMPSCDDGAACTMDVCSESAGGCTHVGSDALCSDGLYCDGVERCAPGAGADVRGCVAGVSIGCADDGFACTTEACDETTMGCTSMPDSSSCGTGTVCTAASGDPASGCTPGRTCTTAADCDDSNVCNGAEACVSGICRAGTNLACADSVSCTTDSCDPIAGCRHVASDAICDDHLVCNGNETCDVALGCRPGVAPICNDGISCTADSCSEAAAGCVHTTNDAVCSNGTFCDGAERCVAGLGCQAGAPPSCSDGISCTTDACSAASDACTHTAVDALCSNAQYCDGVETCSATLGCRPGMPVNCNDGLACSDDTCVEATDSCNHSYNAANCGAGQVCTATGCATGQACTAATASVCNDGQFCNGVETCSSTTSVPGTCQPGTAVDCNDGMTCTTDVCSNAMSSCTYAAWDRDMDGFPDATCAGLGNDCNDLDPNVHPGMTETCDGVDRNCDGDPNNGLDGTGEACNTPSDCCTGACTSGICTLPSTTCHRTQALCTTSADCCSGRCSLTVDGSHRCAVVGGCDIAGEACTTAADCCSTGCVGGVCSDTATCHTQGTSCTSNAQCCSNICSGGICATAGSGCEVDGEICSSNGNCCSGFCTGGRCATHDTCRAGGEICSVDGDCCDGGCDPTTHRCELLGSCSVSGEPCTGQRDCCSALCADAGSGVRICQHLDGCRPYGEICTADSNCCSGECSTADAVGVRRCVNPPGCVDPGEICAQGGSNDCCVLRSRGCTPTGLGVSRCNDSANCIPLGDTCEFSAQCCDGADCLLDGSGVRRCSTMCIGEGFACLADSDCCEGVCLDGFCNPSSSGCTPIGVACGASSECCSLNCDSVCFP